jgi:hypothetical protein
VDEGEVTLKKKVCLSFSLQPTGVTLSQCSPSGRSLRVSGLRPVPSAGVEKNTHNHHETFIIERPFPIGTSFEIPFVDDVARQSKQVNCTLLKTHI